jgi:DNA-binding beta-propeller fold protein YncE
MARLFAATATAVALSAVGIPSASAWAAAPRAVRVSSGVPQALASPGTQLWAKLYNSPSNGPDQANSVAVSPNGSTVYVTGESNNPATVGAYATVAYSATTGAQLWAKRYSSSGAADFANAVAVSPNGNTVFVTGDVGFDYGTIAYNASTGAQLWVKLYTGDGTDNYAHSVAVSPNGNTVYVTGESDSASFVAQYATVAYSAATGTQLWAKRYNGPGSSQDAAHSVAVSPDGNTVFVTGTSTGSTSSGDATVAYNATTGTQLWAMRYNGPLISANSVTNSLAVSPTGAAVYVTGIIGNTLNGDYATIAYNAASGAQLWAKRYAGDGGADSAAVSPDGSTVYVTGDIYSNSYGAHVYTTIAYNAATGAQLWAKQHRGAFKGDAIAYSVAVSPSGGTVYVTGTSAHSANFDYATIAYNATTGAQEWIKLYNGPGNGDDTAYSIAVSPTNGTVLVTGQAFGGSTTGDDYATVAYSG